MARRLLLFLAALQAGPAAADLDAARDRLAEHMCRYAARGFNPGPVYPGYCAADL